MATARIIKQTVRLPGPGGTMVDQPLLEDWMVPYTGFQLGNPKVESRMLEAFMGLRSIAEDKKIGVGAEICIRPLLVSDVPAGTVNLYTAAGLWQTSALTASATAYTTLFNFQLNSAQALCFLAYWNRDTNQQINAIRYGLGNGGTAVKMQLSAEQMMAEDEQVLWHSPVYYIPDEWVPVQALSAQAVTQKAGFLCFICEKQGNTVQGIQV